MRPDDQEFALAWDDALAEGVDGLLVEVHRRAVDGVDVPRTVAGERVDVREYSDVLLAKYIAAHRESWRSSSSKIEHAGTVSAGGELVVRIVDPAERIAGVDYPDDAEGAA